MAGSAAPGEFRRPRPEERAAFEHLQRRGYASGEGTLHPAPPREEATAPAQGDDGARGVFVAGRPLAGAYLKRYQTWWGPDELPMESIGGVVTLPEARRQGYTAALATGLLADMRERGIPISTITSPFSYAFYRQFGWEYAFPRLRAAFPPQIGIVSPRAPGNSARFVQTEHEGALPGEIDGVYRLVARTRYQGMAVRTPELWRRLLRGERTYAYVWDGEDGPAGYAVCAVGEHDRLQVRELFATDRTALAGLFGLLANFDSQAERIEWDMPPDVRLDLLVREQHDLELSWQPQGMFRIVDLAAAVSGRTAGTVSGQVCLRLLDDQAPWNQGPHAITWTEGQARVSPSGGGPAADQAVMDQRTFAQIYAGSITPAQAVELGRAELGAGALMILTAAYVTGRPPLLLEWH